MPDGKPIPAIVFNGNQIPTAADMQALYENDMPPCHYEVQSFDCQILNKNYVPQGGTAGSNQSGKNISILVLVSGYVRYGDSRDEPLKGFSESIVLVPNLEKSGRTTRVSRRDFLIQSQTFRIVV
jgi:NTF2-related export protein 1/2